MYQPAMLQPGAATTPRMAQPLQEPSIILTSARSAGYGQTSPSAAPPTNPDNFSYASPGTDLATVPNAMDMQLAKAETKKSVIHACGRTVLLPDAQITRVNDLQSVLQAELGMQDQIFEIFDLQGKRLILDTDVVEALVDGRTPLTANLCDSSIHFIENRREELAQMQWKLVRDQHNQAQLKLSQMVRQMTTVESKMDNMMRETGMSMDRLRSETQTAIEGCKGEARAESRQLGERIAGVAQHVTAERNMREVSIQQFNKALQGVRDTIDSDRTTVQQGLQLAMSQLSQTREMIELERSAREAFEHRHSQDMQSVNDRMDEMASSLKNVMSEYGRRFEKASQEATEVIESHGRTALKTRSEMDSANAEVMARLNLVEERSATLEQRMLEAQQRQNDTLQRINHKNEKFNMGMEQLKFDGGQQTSNVTSIGTKLQDLETTMKAGEQEAREAHERERRQQQEEMKSAREAVVSEYGRKLELLENKLAARIEREAEARQNTMTVTIENVNAVLKKEGVREIPVPKPTKILQVPISSMTQPAVAEAGRGGSYNVPRLMPDHTPRNRAGSVIVAAGQAPTVTLVPPGATTAPAIVTGHPQPVSLPTQPIVQTGSGYAMPGGAHPMVTMQGSSALVAPPSSSVTVAPPISSVTMAPAAAPPHRIVSGGSAGPTRVR